MQAVATRQSGSTLIRPLVAAAAASVAIAGLISVGTFTGMLPGKRAPMRDEGPAATSDLKPGRSSACALCGTIESMRTVEVYDEPNAAAGAADPKSAPETAAGGPGAAIASGAASVLDSLNGIVSGAADKNERDLRKRIVWRVTLHMDDGSFRAISLPRPPVFAVGDKVRVVEGRLVRA